MNPLPKFRSLALMLLLSACSLSPNGTAATPRPEPPSTGPRSAGLIPITVMAASSLTGPFTEIAKDFESTHWNSKVLFDFAGSQQLAQQLANGAPSDVFASASPQYMDTVVMSGRIQAGGVKTFARNRLVVITPASNPAGLKNLTDLARPGLKLILAAQEVPVGQYSLTFLEKAAVDPAFPPGFKDRVLANVVSYEPDDKTVVTKVALGEADAGIVYSSDVFGASAANLVSLAIPDALNVIANYPIAVVQDSQTPGLAPDFVGFVLGPQGQAILGKYGFVPVTSP